MSQIVEFSFRYRRVPQKMLQMAEKLPISLQMLQMAEKLPISLEIWRSSWRKFRKWLRNRQLNCAKSR